MVFIMSTVPIFMPAAAILMPVPFVSAAVLLVPAAIVFTFFHPLVGPTARLIAVSPSLAAVLGPDPGGTSLGRFFPTPGGPTPGIAFAVPIACDPYVVRAGSGCPSFITRPGGSIWSDADADCAKIHAYPDLAGCWSADEHRENCGKYHFCQTLVHGGLLDHSLKSTSCTK